MNNKGKFIVFEGIDGSGKTTQINKLCEYLESKGRKVYVTSEPTISLTGGMLRDALSGVSKRTSCEMAAMFVLDRIFHNVNHKWGIEKMLDEVHITANKNTIPFETTSPFITSGLRVGTPAVTSRGFKEEECRKVAQLVARVIKEKEACFDEVTAEVKALCAKFPVYANDIQ